MLCVTAGVVSKALRTLLLLLFLLGNSTFQVRRKEQGGFNALKRGLELIRNYFRHPRMISQNTTKKNYFWQQVWRKYRRGTKKGDVWVSQSKILYSPSYQTMTGRVTKENDTHSSERVCVCVGVKNDSIRELPPPLPSATRTRLPNGDHNSSNYSTRHREGVGGGQNQAGETNKQTHRPGANQW